MPTLLISEEYGYRSWVAELSDPEYQELLRRWQTMRGLHCGVPVRMVIPQARELDDMREKEIAHDLYCHIHQFDDSYLTGTSYQIPDDEHFWMDGRCYTDDEIYSWSPTSDSMPL